MQTAKRNFSFFFSISMVFFSVCFQFSWVKQPETTDDNANTQYARICVLRTKTLHNIQQSMCIYNSTMSYVTTSNAVPYIARAFDFLEFCVRCVERILCGIVLLSGILFEALLLVAYFLSFEF